MSASLVGSEMCIRDRCSTARDTGGLPLGIRVKPPLRPRALTLLKTQQEVLVLEKQHQAGALARAKAVD
eukprot:6242314-Alexandrium_andersonii.AAC.1